jgi:hypothetical protein
MQYAHHAMLTHVLCVLCCAVCAAVCLLCACLLLQLCNDWALGGKGMHYAHHAMLTHLSSVAHALLRLTAVCLLAAAAVQRLGSGGQGHQKGQGRPVGRKHSGAQLPGLASAQVGAAGVVLCLHACICMGSCHCVAVTIAAQRACQFLNALVHAHGVGFLRSGTTAQGASSSGLCSTTCCTQQKMSLSLRGAADLYAALTAAAAIGCWALFSHVCAASCCVVFAI